MNAVCEQVLTTVLQRGRFCIVSNWLRAKSTHTITSERAPSAKPNALLTILYVIALTFNH